MGAELRGWNPDPFGIHEFRFFSDDGKATLLARDGDTSSYDKPPQSDYGPLITAPAPAPARAPVARWREPGPEVPPATPDVVRSLREANRTADVKVQAPRHP